MRDFSLVALGAIILVTTGVALVGHQTVVAQEEDPLPFWCGFEPDCWATPECQMNPECAAGGGTWGSSFTKACKATTCDATFGSAICDGNQGTCYKCEGNMNHNSCSGLTDAPCTQSNETDDCGTMKKANCVGSSCGSYTATSKKCGKKKSCF